MNTTTWDAGGRAETIRILHVDDDASFADVVAAFLEREGDRFEVVTATDTRTGIERLADGRFDCVVSDYDMPEQNGIEFLEAVRETHPDLPFILFTGKGSEEIASDAISAGVTDYLQKGGGTSQYTVLANRIENAVEQYRSKQALADSQKRLSLFVKQSPLGVIEWDQNFDVVSLNGTAEKILGHTEDDLVSESWQAIVPDSDREPVGDVVANLLEAEGGYHSVNENVTADGERIVCEWHNRVVTDDEGVVAIFSQFRDVTEREQRQAELQRTERRYQAVFDDPNILVGLLDTDGSVLDINQTAMEYVSATVEQLVGEPFWETPWFEQSRATQTGLEEWIDRAADGEYVEFEAELTRPDGASYAVDGVIRPVTDDEGTVVSLLVSTRDVTAQRDHERELEQANALLSTLFETLPVGVLAEDASRDVLAVNEQLFELFELSGTPETATGADCDRMAEEVSGMFDDSQGFVERIEELIDERERVRGEQLTIRDGRTFARSYEPIQFADGEGHLWVYRDVTGREEHERRLRALSETTRSLLTADTREAVADLAVDAAGEILGLDANAIHLYDDDRGELVPVARTEPMCALVADPPSFAGGESIAWRVYESGEPLAIDDVHDDPDVYNPETSLRSELYLPLGEHGILIAAAETPGTFDQRDVALGEILAGNVTTALAHVEWTNTLQSRERELAQQNDRLEEFASIVSHDLRNPLNVATARLEMATEECDSENLDHVARAHDRMEALVDDLLTLAHDGELASDQESVDLVALVEECWETVETGEATLAVRTGQTIRADRSRLQQLLENLVRNSVKHSSTGSRPQADDSEERSSSGSRNAPRSDDSTEHADGEVTVTVGALDDGFYVEDDGPGIDPEERGEIFEPGYSTASDGTGFGLSIVRQVADAHGWEVRATEGDDGGARFEITGVEVER